MRPCPFCEKLLLYSLPDDRERLHCAGCNATLYTKAGVEGECGRATHWSRRAALEVAKKLEGLVAAGIRMRESQRNYFREARTADAGRKRELMAEAKAAESAFDRLLSGIPDGEPAS